MADGVPEIVLPLEKRIERLSRRLASATVPTAAEADAVVREVSAFADACEEAGAAGPAAMARGIARIADDGADPAERLAFLTSGVRRLRELLADLSDLSGEPTPPAPVRSAGPAAIATSSAAAPEPRQGWAVAADPELLPAFVGEATEHLEAAEPHLLTLEADPRDRDALDAVFRSFHSVKGTAGFVGLSGVTAVAHEAESLLDRARDGAVLLRGSAFEQALAALDLLRGMVRRAGETGCDEPLTPAALAIIDGLRAATCGTIPAATTSPPATEPARAEVVASEAPEARGQDPAPTGVAGAGAKPAAADQVRVDRQRLDRLVDLIGELVIAESMTHALTSSSAGHDRADGDRAFAQLRKITRELQELSLSLRMVPVGGLFPKLSRLVRDLSHKLGKPVDFVTEGGETELDKTVVDQVADPLMHLIRNALDHGVESAADRLAAGKPAKATLRLTAYHRGGDIHVELSDDGRGLDRKKILAKAVDRGLVASAEGLSDQEIDRLIFAPGFSTADKVSEVSGRGVGMDVARRNIEALQGDVSLASEPGRGTTVMLRLPLTLAIVDGMVVRVGAERFILPTLNIVEQLRPRPSMLAVVGGRRRLVAVRGRHVPFYGLDDLFGPGAVAAVRDVCDGIIVLVEDKDRLAGLLVDEVIGQQQVVIKSLGESLERLPGVAGGAVLPDGRVGVVLDVTGLLDLANGAPPAIRRAG